jgi:CRISPR system Cascade subunit CasD
MATILLRLSAPMQAWGTQSHFTHRDTGREPSKSGVVGLLCAALGRPRHEPIRDLAALRMGVRVDQEGVMRKDYHTAGMGGIYIVEGRVKSDLIVSDRYYLADAKFLVGLEGEADRLMELQAALQQPAWFLSLGRKAFVPAERVWLKDGLQDTDLWTALSTFCWLGSGVPPAHLRVVIEDPAGLQLRSDQPLSFEPRRFLPRSVSTFYVERPQKRCDDVPVTTDP